MDLTMERREALVALLRGLRRRYCLWSLTRPEPGPKERSGTKLADCVLRLSLSTACQEWEMYARRAMQGEIDSGRCQSHRRAGSFLLSPPCHGGNQRSRDRRKGRRSQKARFATFSFPSFLTTHTDFAPPSHLAFTCHPLP